MTTVVVKSAAGIGRLSHRRLASICPGSGMAAGNAVRATLLAVFIHDVNPPRLQTAATGISHRLIVSRHARSADDLPEPSRPENEITTGGRHRVDRRLASRLPQV